MKHFRLTPRTIANLALLFGLLLLIYGAVTSPYGKDDGRREAVVTQSEELRGADQEPQYRLTIVYDEDGTRREDIITVDADGNQSNWPLIEDFDGIPTVGERITVYFLTPAPVPGIGQMLGFYLILFGLVFHFGRLIKAWLNRTV